MWSSLIDNEHNIYCDLFVVKLVSCEKMVMKQNRKLVFDPLYDGSLFCFVNVTIVHS